jgi:hypothetical protein
MSGASGGTAAVQVTAVAGARIVANRINGGPTDGIRIFASNATPVFVKNTIFTSGGNGIHFIDVGTVPCVLYNTIVSNTADGIHEDTGNGALGTIIGNMITDNTGDGIDMVSTANAAFTANNRFRDNASTYNNAGDWITATSYNDITSGAGTSDYVNSAGNNYNLIYTSPGFHAGKPAFESLGALEPPTPTPTATATATATATPTNTPTPTVTPTPCAGGVSRARIANPQ